jgi:hypothetical protein
MCGAKEVSMSDFRLTEEELSILTPFDCLAHDVMRKRLADEGKIAPCWLVCSDESREKARDKALRMLRGASGRLTMTTDEAKRMAEKALNPALVEHWRGAEASHKFEREAGNPLAFFT